MPQALLIAVVVAVNASPVVAPKPKPVSKFEKTTIEGWTVYVSRAALRDNRDETSRALDHLANQLFQITLSLPAEAVEKLRQVPIWLANGEKKLGVAFHPNRSWLTSRGYAPPPPRSLIGIVSGRHYLRGSVRQPWLALHELSHGYDWFVLGRKKTYGSNAAAYKRAMKSGKYDSALHWNGRRRKPYHATNKMEFFAETSEAFFGTNDIFPFVRAELRDHDPATFRMLAELWKVDLKKQKRREQELVKLLSSQPLITGLKEGKSRAEEPSAVKFTPTKQYHTKRIEGWTVRVHPQLASNKKATALTLRLLRRDLHYVKRYVPAAAVSRLQKTVVWVEQNNPNTPYAAYHSSRNWLKRHGDNPEKAHGVEIGNAAKYRRWFPLQPSLLVHLLAYGYLDRELGTDNREVAAALKQARNSGRYDSVLRFDGRRVRHPALSNIYEFFAEMSETLFGTNDHFPFLRYELKEQDPKLHALFQRLWNRPAGKTSQR